MVGVLIYGSYGQFYSFVIADNKLYKATKKELSNNNSNKVYFGKGNLTPQQLDNVRDKVSEVVKRLNNKEKVNVKKELSSYFTK
jgi:hypothetical protein